MASSVIPTVFVSSTCYDLGEVRSQVERFIREHGYSPLLSEYPSFPVHPERHAVDNCVATVRDHADLFVLVIGNRRGSETDSGATVTNLEYQAARDAGIPIWVFVNRTTMTLFDVWRANPTASLPGVEDNRIFEFIDQVRSAGHWVTQFDSGEDICSGLRQQWAVHFRELLSAPKQRATAETADIAPHVEPRMAIPPSSFAPSQVCPPHVPDGHFLVVRGVVSCSFAPDGDPMLSPEFRSLAGATMGQGLQADAWMGRWLTMLPDGCPSSVSEWERDHERSNRGHLAFRRAVTLKRPNLVLCSGQLNLAASSWIQGPQGLWAICDLAVSTLNEQQAIHHLEHGSLHQGIRPRPLSKEEVHITVKAALETSASLMELLVTTFDADPNSQMWSSYLRAPHHLDEVIAFPNAHRRHPFPTDLELSESPPLRGPAPDLDVAIDAWWNHILLAMSLD